MASLGCVSMAHRQPRCAKKDGPPADVCGLLNLCPHCAADFLPTSRKPLATPVTCKETRIILHTCCNLEKNPQTIRGTRRKAEQRLRTVGELCCRPRQVLDRIAQLDHLHIRIIKLPCKILSVTGATLRERCLPRHHGGSTTLCVCIRVNQLVVRFMMFAPAAPA